MRALRRTSCLVLSTLVLVWAVAAEAAVTLPSVIGDHMVLQQGKKPPIWGKAEPGEPITVSIDGQEETAVADEDGKWMVKLHRMHAGGPHEMTIEGKEDSITLADILVGEVWVASGQSNMQWTVSNSNNAEHEIAAAKHPNMRLFTVTRTVAAEPREDCEGAWVACSPETVPGFSAAAYYFGRMLLEELDVPVGMIHTSWGGTPAESWTSMPSLESEPICKPIIERWEKILADYPQAKEAYDKKVVAWQKAVEKAKAEGKQAPKKPREPLGPDHPHRPAGLYNAMIAPLAPFAIQGAIWYQGESNASRAYQYRTLFPLMIKDWRASWGQRAFPFYFVQLANWKERQPEPGDDSWAELREAQLMALDLRNTGMAVIIDIGDAKDIHPKNKQDVGKRLALNALAKTYGKKIACSGPIYRSMRRKGNKIVLSFKHTDGGLQATGGAPLKGFTIAGEDRKFVWADARIVRKKVVVRSDEIERPVAVRYAWAINPECNLYNGAGLPASPFRTDDWPGVTVDAR